MKRMLVSTAVLALGSTGLVAAATSAQAAVVYKNCDAVRAAGKAPLYPGQYGYRLGLDANHNGVACEGPDYVAPTKPAPVVTAPSKPAPAPTTKPAPAKPLPVVSPPSKPAPAKPAPGTVKPLPVVAPGHGKPAPAPAETKPMGPKVSTDLVTPKQDGVNSAAALLAVGAVAGLGVMRLRAAKR